VGAAAKALAGFADPVVWIAGGRGKGADFSALAEVARSHARLALLIGEDAGRLAEALEDAVPCECVERLDRAVSRAHEIAKPGDVVLLAPACASFDQFENFGDRGDAFVALVEKTIAGAARR
jgi:UDP-N-acetylmuramoylalanine--D-glutamate ligase